VTEILDAAIRSPRFDPSLRPEVAFYGGTFTGLSEERIMELLGAVMPYLREGLFHSIRLSTRPDALQEGKLELLRRFGVSTVELGAQSMDNRVLDLSRRGHLAEHTVAGVRGLQTHGFKVGIQLMPGLPGDTEEGFRRTVDRVLELKPDMVRLYPALVIRGTELETRYLEGLYRPLTLWEAVRICVEATARFERNGIPVIRIGLMSSPSLLEEGTIVAGPWHRAFGFLVRSKIHRQRIGPLLPEPGRAERIRLRVPRREIPLVRGHENTGLREIEEKSGAVVVEVRPDDSLLPGRLEVDLL
jgi:histone acetyltransferase (RNA polymerase elongator complex component)